MPGLSRDEPGEGVTPGTPLQLVDVEGPEDARRRGLVYLGELDDETREMVEEGWLDRRYVRRRLKRKHGAQFSQLITKGSVVPDDGDAKARRRERNARKRERRARKAGR